MRISSFFNQGGKSVIQGQIKGNNYKKSMNNFFSTFLVIFALIALFFSCCLNFVFIVCWQCCFLHQWWCCFMFWWCFCFMCWCCYFLLVIMLMLCALVLPFSSTFKPKTCCYSHVGATTCIGAFFVSLVSLVLPPFLPCASWSLEHQTNP